MKIVRYNPKDLSFLDDINYSHLYTGMGGLKLLFDIWGEKQNNHFHVAQFDNTLIDPRMHTYLPITSYQIVFYDGEEIVAQAILDYENL